ncbi:hypothetical protein I7I48_11178 [Histoplasma ohiense]|nr:hypothetical protein I7I48_11178 [Histoplasma ohiense (nom. inval.)]
MRNELTVKFFFSLCLFVSVAVQIQLLYCIVCLCSLVMLHPPLYKRVNLLAHLSGCPFPTKLKAGNEMMTQIFSICQTQEKKKYIKMSVRYFEKRRHRKTALFRDSGEPTSSDWRIQFFLSLYRWRLAILLLLFSFKGTC